MSAEIIPRWQRGIIAWLLNSVANDKDAPLCCPSCRRTVPDVRLDSDLAWDRTLVCSHCGYAASPLAFGQHEPDPESLVRDAAGAAPPATSRIEVVDSAAGRTWRIPPLTSRRSAPVPVIGKAMLVFGISLIVTLSGKGGGSSPVHWSEIIFFAVAGLVMFCPILFRRRVTHVLRVAENTFRHERIASGEPEVVIWPHEAIHSVSIGVLFSENYTPVYEVEVRGTYGTLRFGADLDPEEKAWLCHDIRTALRLEPVAGASRAVISSAGANAPVSGYRGENVPPSKRLIAEREGERLVLRCSSGIDGAVLSIVGLVVCLLIGCLFGSGLVLGNFKWGNVVSPVDWLRLLFPLVTCLGLSAFFFLGLLLVLFGWRVGRVRKRIEVSTHAVRELTTCGKVRLDRSWDAHAVRAVIATADTKQSSFRRGEIVLPGRVIGFGMNCDHATLRRVVGQLRQILDGAAPSAINPPRSSPAPR